MMIENGDNETQKIAPVLLEKSKNSADGEIDNEEVFYELNEFEEKRSTASMTSKMRRE